MKNSLRDRKPFSFQALLFRYQVPKVIFRVIKTETDDMNLVLKEQIDPAFNLNRRALLVPREFREIRRPVSTFRISLDT